MKRIEILTGMHLGPIKREVKAGDILAWNLPTRTLTLNGQILVEDKGMDFEEAINMLDRQREKFPDQSWSKELSTVNVNIGELDVKTGTQVVFPILGCLQSAEDFLGNNRGWYANGRKIVWTPSNEDQYQFIKRFLESKNLVDALGDNLKRKADTDVRVINAWLKEHGFDIQLTSEVDPRTFAVASILDVLVEWVKEGKVTSIYNNKGTFPAVSMKNEDEEVCAWVNRTTHPFPIVGIRTKSGDLVRMSVLDFMPDDTFAISDKVDRLMQVCDGQNRTTCNGVIFPMVDYNRTVDIGWICGLETGSKSDDYYIGQAVQQTKFRMNEKGARAQSAAAMSLRYTSFSSMDHWVLINKPFILWIERPGVNVPLFTGVFAEDVWKKPAGL